MTIYAGVISGAEALRNGVEGLLTNDPNSIAGRLWEQESTAQAGGWQASFGEEVEYKFIANPDTNRRGFVPNKEDTYEEIVAEFIDPNLDPSSLSSAIIGRGRIVNPRAYRWDIVVNPKLENSYNPYQPATGISELRSAPSMDALTSIERYWGMLGAIGRVAARYDCIGLILGTDTSIAFYPHPIASLLSKPVDLYEGDGSKLVAATQHNLQALLPLQINAGLKTRTIVEEALPHKSATSCIHPNRLERKCSLVGVIDPRIPRLAGLAALNQYIDGTIPSAALEASRACRVIEFKGNSRFLDTFSSGLVLWDDINDAPVLPAELADFSFSEDDKNELNELVGYLTDGACTDFMEDNGLILRQAFACIKFDHQQRRVRVDTTMPYGSKMFSQLDGADFAIWQQYNRTIPAVKEDSPEIHLQRRASLAKSSTVRVILGSATRSLVPAQEAINRRAKLIAEEMYDFSDLVT